MAHRKPTCDICGAKHWPREPHVIPGGRAVVVRADSNATRAARAAAAEGGTDRATGTDRTTLPSRDITEELRWQVWERDNFTCLACGVRRFLVIDHVVPRAEGGPTELGNLQTLCGECNSAKRDRSMEWPLERVAKRPKPTEYGPPDVHWGRTFTMPGKAWCAGWRCKCGHEWLTKGERPARCPKCKSRTWDRGGT